MMESKKRKLPPFELPGQDKRMKVEYYEPVIVDVNKQQNNMWTIYFFRMDFEDSKKLIENSLSESALNFASSKRLTVS